MLLMFKSLKRVFVFSLLLCLLLNQVGCAYTNRGKTTSFFDTQFDKSQLQINRVAIIPNRLPLMVKEPEYWRKTNWELISKIFKDHGYEVIDYESTNIAFQNANLPIEDTGSSAEKFAQAASELNADVLIMPYYASVFTGNAILSTSQMNYNAQVSLQIYSSLENRFIFRADADANSGFASYTGLFAALMPIINSSGSDSSGRDPIAPILKILFGGVALGFVIGDLVNGLTPAEEWWKRAFTEAIKVSLEPFFSLYPSPTAIDEVND